ncbi:diguanylate cyclase domain-containing protein [Massilia sp. HP4]|uniref:diguanylate cyclase domain-containing protein n=1 Tax=Massilia sp. HP4 TaxID=2562316 RepID=UPI0010C0A224|nr:diguanylate cyclase [Massilia sp. HP4]
MPYSTSSNPFVARFGGYFRRRVLRQLALYLALMLAVVWGGVALEQARFSTLAESGGKANVQNLSRAFSEEVKATVALVDLSLIQLRGTWQRDPADFPHSVAEHVRHLRVPMHITVTDAGGSLLYSDAAAGATPAPQGLALGDLRQFAVYREQGGDRLYVSRSERSRISRQWMVQFTRPIRTPAGRLAGVIAVSIPPEYFLRFYDSIDLGPDATVSLLRLDATVIARSSRADGNRHMGATIPDAPQTRDASTSGAFRRSSHLDGIERFYAWHKLPEYGLVVTVGQAVRDAEARFAQQREVMRSAGLVVSLGLALLGWAAIGAADRRRHALKALAAAEARWKMALNAAGDGVWDSDVSTGLVTLSPNAQRILDSEHPVVSWFGNDSLAGLVHPDELPAVRAALRAHIDGFSADYAMEHRLRTRDGAWRWIEARGTVTEWGERGEPLRMIGTFSNIDARKQEEQRMRRMAHEDALTGLPNRVLLHDRMRQAILAAGREGHKVALVYFDLDNFKPVNDTHGHAVGDRLLRMVAQRVRAALRESDTLARVGGDEFAVLLPRCAQPQDAERVAATILARLEQPFDDGERILRISGSLGYALYPDCGPGDGDAAESLLHCADLAMYDAKAHGRNRISGSYRTRII